MKTAMQEYAEHLRSMAHVEEDYVYKSALNNIASDLEINPFWIEKEKQQIIEAGNHQRDVVFPMNPKQYYNDTFKK